MSSDHPHHWAVRKNGQLLGEFSETDLRHELSKMSLEGVEVRQGNSMWHPAIVVVERFARLDQEGIYLRGGDQMVGPFTVERAIELVDGKKTEGFEARIGIRGAWIPAGTALEELKGLIAQRAQAAAEQTSAASSHADPVGKSASNSPPANKPKQEETFESSPKLQTCSGCGAKMNITNLPTGKLAACPSCKTQFRVGQETGGATGVNDRPPSPTKKVQAKPVHGVPVQGVPVQGIPVQGVPVQGNLGEVSSFDNLALPPALKTPPAPRTNPLTPAYQPPRAAPTAFSEPRSSTSMVQYVVPGVLICCWGIFIMLFGIFRIGVLVFILANMENASMNIARISGSTVGAIVFVCIAGVFIYGGISMIRLKDLRTCRTAAILAAIPCCGWLSFPFGIWACVALFSEQAKQDFSS